jgi:hypothetical protein
LAGGGSVPRLAQKTFAAGGASIFPAGFFCPPVDQPPDGPLPSHGPQNRIGLPQPPLSQPLPLDAVVVASQVISGATMKHFSALRLPHPYSRSCPAF